MSWLKDALKSKLASSLKSGGSPSLEESVLAAGQQQLDKQTKLGTAEQAVMLKHLAAIAKDDIADVRNQGSPDARNQFDSIHLGHAQIDHHHVGPDLFNARERGRRRRDGGHFRSGGFEHQTQQRERIFLVVDGEDADPLQVAESSQRHLAGGAWMPAPAVAALRLHDHQR